MTGVVPVVFIAGCSFGGTTLLGAVLGSDPGTRFAGEINQYMRQRNRFLRRRFVVDECSCGRRYERCPFWGPVLARRPVTADLNPAPGFSRGNVRLLLRILRPGLRKTMHRLETEYGELVAAIHEAAREAGGDVERIVDSSKSIRSLDALARSGNVRVKVVHVIRDGLDVAGSYKRRGYGAYRGVAGWVLVHLFLKLYLRRSGIPHLELAYRSLCDRPADELRRLNAFLGTRIDPDHLVEAVRSTEYHMFGGNLGVRRVTREFEGLRFRGESGTLNRLERAVAAAVAAPVGRLLGTGAP